MKSPRSVRYIAVLVVVLSIAFSSGVAQQNAGSAVTAIGASVVPRLVSFSGVLNDASGKPISNMSGVTFLIYRDEQGGAPLWLETQNVTPDRTGHYSVQLGATRSDGLPADMFLSGEARWLAVQIAGDVEKARVLLVAVPYAMKAADAETIGGLPPSAFVLAAPGNGTSTAASTSGATALVSSANAAPTALNVTTTGGTLNTLPLWTTSTNIQSSTVSQTGTGSTAKIGIGTTTPGATLDVKGGANIQGLVTAPKSKNGKARHIPLNTEALGAFTELSKRRSPAGWVFATVDGERLCGYKHWFGPAVETAGIRDFTWYCLRHTFASRLAMAGVDLRTVAVLMGHKTIQMTMRYAHLAPEHNLAAVEKLVSLNSYSTKTGEESGDKVADSSGSRLLISERSATRTATFVRDEALVVLATVS